MRNTNFLFLFLFCFLGVNLALSAQDLPSLQGWLDENHFILEKNSGQVVKINAQTAKEMPHRSEKQESAADYLPAGMRANSRNSISTPNQDKVILNERNDLFFLSLEDKKFRQLTATPAPEQNPVFSPNGQKVAYTRDYNLYVLDLATGLEKQLTTDGGGLVYNGWASWVYYEEILGRSSRYRAFYWSPDSEKIAYLRFDDTTVPEFPIFHHESDDMTHGMLEKTRYPKSGDPNPLVKLGVVDITSGLTTWVEQNPDLEYTAWIFWAPGGELLYQQMNRDQNVLHIYKADPVTGRAQKIYEESQPTWVEFFEEIEFLADGRSFVLCSNRDGWYNLYHYDLDGNLINRLTKNHWRVTDLVRVDEAARRVFFMGTGPDETERHLFSVEMDGTNQTQLTEGAGVHEVHLSPTGDYFVDEFSSVSNPGEMHIRSSKDARSSRLLGADRTDANLEAGLKVEQFTIHTGDGFELPAQWVLPPNFDRSKKYPVIFRVYGGPGAESVYNRYMDYANDLNVQKGAIRFTIDHRACGKFGKKGLDYMHRNLGKWEMNDYIEAVKWLRQQGFIDESRIGITGGSYGGYVTALALTYASDYFTHGISSFPVTDWRLYDNVYTERYMDTPADNPEGYRFGSVLTHASKLKGKLLLVHGTIDDNVHFQNTVQLVSELQDLGKDFEVMFYPGGRHGWGGPKRNHYVNLMDRFWDRLFFNTTAGSE